MGLEITSRTLLGSRARVGKSTNSNSDTLVCNAYSNTTEQPHLPSLGEVELLALSLGVASGEGFRSVLLFIKLQGVRKMNNYPTRKSCLGW